MAHIRSGGAPVEVGGVRLAAVGVDVRADVHRGPSARQRGAQISGATSPIDGVLARAGVRELTTLEVDVAPAPGGAAARTRTRTRSGAPGAVRVEVPVEAGTGNLLLVEEDGVLRWILPTKAEVATRGAAAPARTFEIPIESPPAAGAQTRGVLGAIGKRVVRVLGFELFDSALGKVGDFFVSRWEKKHHPHRLRTFTPEDYSRPPSAELGPDDIGRIARAGRALLVIHGTGSLTHSGFGLIPREAVTGLNQRYGGRVVAFDHPTLSPTPLENARWLADHLPAGIGLDVDILCHSRGGLVARSLAERASQINLDPSTMRVGSVTFVATPNSGTALCDPAHLSQLVDSFTNLLDLVPDNPVVDVMNALIEMLKQLAVGAYGGLDGAMSMDPAGEFLRQLNREPGTTARYFAIAADYEPSGDAPAARRFRDLLLDKVFGAPNDLIVPTESVYAENGSPMFPITDTLVLTADRAVDHSTFWISEPVLDAFTAWLPPPPPGARPGAVAPRAIAPTLTPAAPDPAPAPDRTSTEAEPDPATPVKPVLDVRVLHASIESASYPVLVGHYEGSPIAGAEAFIDARLHGRLTHRQLAGLYPGELGEVLVIDGDEVVPGVLVVGLGHRGELSPSSLSKAVTKVVLSYALDLAERKHDTRRGLSSVIVGSNGADGLLIKQSVLAIVEGTATALRTLAEQRPGEPLPIDELEIVEVYARRAHRAAHAINERDRYLPAALVDFIDIRAAVHIEHGDGARPGDLPYEYDSGSWRRVVVSCTKTDDEHLVELDFTSFGLRARADRLTQTVDRVLLQRLVSDAMQQPDRAEQINRALFEMLFPGDLKHELATIDKLHLVVDETAADFPWELLADRDAPGASEALAVRTGMLRQLQLVERRRLERGVASELSAIVVGNPPGGSSYPFLDGAVTEAKAVVEAFGGRGFDVTTFVWDGSDGDRALSSSTLSAALLSQDFRIVHIAAHGHFEESTGGTPRGGVVIDDGVYLTASTIGQMRRPPDVVFLNCCHLGRVGAMDTNHPGDRAFIEQNLNRFAASLARELMRCGVRAVLAAGWPVADAAAAVFARSFYEQMLDGAAYGDAVAAARRAAYGVEDGGNTWAAYQCYGDPAFRLATPARGAPARIRPVGPDELIRILADLAVDAGDPGVDNDALIQQVRELEHDLVPAWRERGDVLAAFGKAYGELQTYEDGIRCYRDALTAAHGSMTLTAVEQLANLSVRHAAALHRDAGAAIAPDTARLIDELFRDAERRLLQLIDLGDTAERRALLGSVYKRWARVSSRRELVASAIDQYLRSDLPWGKLNALQLSAVSDAAVPDDVASRLQDSRQWLTTFVPTSKHDYWDRVAPVDAALTLALLDDALGDQVDTILQRYRDVFRGGRTTPRERDATAAHLADLAGIAAEAKRAALEQMCIDLRDPAMSAESPVGI